MANLTQTDYRVPSGVDGLSLLLRRKAPASAPPPTPETTVLFVHGATYASTLTVDYAIDGLSWMDSLAAAGFDTWCLDLLGYGGSDRPPEMDAPPDDNPPLVDTAQAVDDLGRAVDVILAERGIDRLCLIGYSWGSAITGGYAGRHADKVARLVLYGAIWLGVGGGAVTAAGRPGAYRTVDAEAVIARWQSGLDADQLATIAPPQRFRDWAEAAIASDPAAGMSDPPRLRAPAGVVKDVLDHWRQDRPTYDPAKIQAPTLVVVGEWDRETTPEQGRGVFDRLENAADRRYTVIGRATHSMLLENQRHALHNAVEGFLKEGWTGG